MKSRRLTVLAILQLAQSVSEFWLKCDKIILFKYVSCQILLTWRYLCLYNVNTLTPNDPCSGRTASLTSERCILCIYSINIGTEYFKHGIHSLFFPLQNTFCFIILTYLVPVLFTFYIQDVLKLKKIIPAPKSLTIYSFMFPISFFIKSDNIEIMDAHTLTK